MHNCHNISFRTYYSTAGVEKKNNKIYCRR